MSVSNLLGRLAAVCARWAGLVAAAALALAVLGVLAVRVDLGVTTDTGRLFSMSLPWKQRQAELRAAFPQGEALLVVVVNAAIPEEADATVAALADALARDHRHFSSVRRPDASPYLERNALLFVRVDALRALLDQTIDAQSFLGQLAADPNLRGLLGALSLLG